MSRPRRIHRGLDQDHPQEGGIPHSPNSLEKICRPRLQPPGCEAEQLYGGHGGSVTVRKHDLEGKEGFPASGPQHYMWYHR